MNDLTLRTETALQDETIGLVTQGLTFCQLEELTAEAHEIFLAELNNNMDIGFSHLVSSSELIEVFQKKLAYWVIRVEDEPIGLFGLSSSLTRPNHYQTSSLIIKKWRGKGIGPLVKQATAQGFLYHELPLIACVRDWNTASIRSMSRAFPELLPELQLSALVTADNEQYYLYIYDLSKVAFVEVPVEADKIMESLMALVSQLKVAEL